MSKRNLSTGAIIAALFAVFFGDDAWAIPAFARKYQTSCHTCHIAFPKLNPFGSAFRLRGYRMPDESEDMVKEVPTELGVDAYKRVWPKAIWPSDIPGTVPLAIDIALAGVTARNAEADETTKNDFRFPERVNLLAAGTFGDLLSFLANVEFDVQDEHGETRIDVGIGRAQLNFNGPWGSGTAFNAKFGRFTPEMTQQFSHNYTLMDTVPASMLGFAPIGVGGSSEVVTGGHGGGGAGIPVPAVTEGIEVYGIAAHRFDYSGGISNGIGPGDATRDGNNAKDVFGRVGYKFGGMSLDGEEYEASAKNWRETSLRIGAFGYLGDGKDILFAGASEDSFVEDREFTRAGFDLNLYWRDVNVIAGFTRGRDTLAVLEGTIGDGGEPVEPVEDEHGESRDLEEISVGDFTYKSWFAEADYVFYPWLHGGFRYEWLRPSDRASPNFNRWLVNGTALVRANVKALVEYYRDVSEERDDYVLRWALRFAF
ncbi:MAG: hypothetical protein BMS9Abin37_2872 [Acidobacteriota bacterium]|nr:MAG: hypothetical protein BMS9Abin37_2872 [Acidobacteriota bacterium]